MDADMRELGDNTPATRARQLAGESVRLLLESVEDCALLTLDLAGHVIDWNARAERVHGYRAEDIVGQHVSILSRADDSLAGQPDELLRVALTEGRVEAEGWRVRQDGILFWARVVTTALRDEAGQPCGFAQVVGDLTRQRRAERSLTTAHQVTRVLASATTIDDALRSTLGVISTNLDWEWGALWRLEPNTNRLRCVYLWHPSGTDATTLAEDALASLFASGEGRPGMVWASGDAIWIADITREPDFWWPRLGMEGVLHSAVAVPIQVEGACIAVMEFLSSEIRPRDESLVQTLRNLSEQIGQFAERKRAEDVIQRHALTFATIYDAVIITDAERRIVDWNPAAERMFGYTREEALGQTPSLIFRPHEREIRARTVVDEVQRAGRWSGEFVFLRKDGTEGMCEATVTPVFDAAGRLVGRIGVNRDITERKQAEEQRAQLAQEQAARAEAEAIAAASRLSEERYRRLTENAPDVIFRYQVAPSPGITYVNSVVTDLIGYKPEELYADRDLIRQIIHPDDRHRLDAFLASPRANGRRSDVFRWLHKDGTVRWIEHRDVPVFDDHGNLLAFEGIARDITESKRAEDERQQYLAREQMVRTEAESARQRLALLAEAGRLLANSLDGEAVLSDIAALMVPDLADWCVVDLLEDDAPVRLAAVAHVNPAKEALIVEMRRRFPLDLSRSTGITRVLRSGEPALYPLIDEAWRESVARAPDHLRLMREIGGVSLMTVPLIARERTLGALTLVSSESGRHYSAADLELAMEMAGRCALALDNARLYREVREALRDRDESLALLDATLAASPVAIAFLDTNLRFMRVNEAGAAMNGVPVEEHVGRPLHEIVPKMAPMLEPIFRQILATGQPVINLEVSGETPAQIGQTRHWLASYYPVHARNVGMLGIGIVAAEITELKRAEEEQGALGRAAQALVQETALERVAEIVIEQARQVLAADAVLLWIADLEKAELRLLAHRGISAPTAEMARVVSIYSPHAPPAQAVREERLVEIANLQELGAESARILQLADQEGGLRSLVAQPLLARGNQVGVLVSASRDARVSTARERDLIRAFADLCAVAIENARLYRESDLHARGVEEARQHLQRFIGMAAHEIGNPLAIVMGYAQMLRSRAENVGATSDQQMLKSVIEAARKMRRLTDDLRDAARIGAGHFEITPMPTDLAEVAREVVREARLLTARNELSVEAPESLTGIWDGVRLNQLLTNLVVNAIKYSPRGGQVRVEVHREGGEARASISDRGEGMVQEDIDQLFQPFGRLKQESDRGIEGAGLGLYICRAIVEAHGGRIWAESPGPGKGTTFFFTLPLR